MLQSFGLTPRLFPQIASIIGAMMITCAASAAAQSPPLLLISVDGLSADYLSSAAQHKVRMPYLRDLMSEGAYASGVVGVLPTITYPSHTTLVTGVSPAKHGIGMNHPFDPSFTTVGSWYWFAEDIRVPTLWSSVRQAGRTVASVSWPVTVGNRDISFNIPEYVRTRTAEDLKALRAMASPNLMDELEKTVGTYLMDKNLTVTRDWSRTRYTLEILRLKRPDFMTLHIIASDHVQHNTGPNAPDIYSALEEIDRMIRELGNAMRAQHPAAVLAVVSDHGFSPVDNLVHLDGAFVKEGLITLKAEGRTLDKSEIQDWVAMPSETGGSAPVFLRNPADTAARRKVKALLEKLKSDPANGIAAVFDEKEIAAMGGTADAQFWVDLKSGYAFSGTLSGPLRESVDRRGTHGYSPAGTEMHSVFVVAGGNVRRNHNLGIIDMRSIAPTLARAMNVSLPMAELPPLEIFQVQGNGSLPAQ
jgi:predicted AlkP superfamily pyrophosphatase or phosphodiesterase